MNIAIIFSIMSLVLWAISFIYLRYYVSHRTSHEKILSDLQNEVGRLVADIDAATDRDLSLIEDRVKALKALLDDTDRRIVSYRRELDRRVTEEQAYAELGRRRRPVSQEPIVIKEQETPQSIEIKSPRFIRSARELNPKPPPISEQVLDLYRASIDPALIATKLGITIAEVELIINLTHDMEH